MSLNIDREPSHGLIQHTFKLNTPKYSHIGFIQLLVNSDEKR